MFERVLVPLDGSPRSEALLSRIPRFLRSENAELILVRAAQILAVEPFSGLFETDLDQATAYLSAVEKRLAAQGMSARGIAELARPADLILRMARNNRVSLIALSTHGRTGASRVVLGSVTEEVLRKSPVPVLVARSLEEAPAKEHARPIRNILVPLDGSDNGLKALRPALETGRLFGARIVLLYVIVPEREPGVPSPQDYLRKAGAQAEAEGLSTLRLVDSGDPAKRILDVSRILGSISL